MFQSLVSNKAPDGLHVQLLTVLMTFFTTLYVYFCSITCNNNTKKLPEATEDFAFQTSYKDEFRPPSPMPPPSFTDTEILSSLMKKLCELEERVNVLEEKPSAMPYEKEELLNAAVCRVDALEAELISTKKSLHEALMRQEELLAYIDSQKDAKFRKKFCM